MAETTTTEFSFILKPSEHGIGVFAVHDIKAGTYLRLFAGETELTDRSVKRNKKDVPEFFRQYCVDRGEILMCPQDFGHMELGWHLNHSKMPNAYHKNYDYYALRDIKEGEEITVDYNFLEEPEEAKEDYYK
ncbi:MAG: SET domain-containing protein [Candidatus Yanofskybacteria bacterium]|nr:SET domain-containing protein [Candidatus Yanofskybacteria bacterium]